MAALTETTKREFAKRVLDILSDASTLKDSGVNAETKVNALKAALDDAFSAEKTQAQIAADMKKATADSQNKTEKAYSLASAAVELVVGARGKNDTLSMKLKKLRPGVANTAARGKRKTA